ncbi:hypothetical protein [Frankia sp. R82]|uniref:hypothetical protein n=1 Tax=Frankia sp. R82 TaxID=2950553 RepID=UPI002042C185|nr:hypothetical protein [Frankia sp. R82]MCM3883147.1 hypothetical protein [Frankia sp. R82]
MTPERKTMRVTLDSLGEYEVPASDVSWNGFAVPGFTLDQVREIAANLDLSRLAIGSDDQETITIGEDGTVTMRITGSGEVDDPDREETVTPDPHDGLYYIGGHRWAWEFVDE